MSDGKITVQKVTGISSHEELPSHIAEEMRVGIVDLLKETLGKAEAGEINEIVVVSLVSRAGKAKGQKVVATNVSGHHTVENGILFAAAILSGLKKVLTAQNELPRASEMALTLGRVVDDLSDLIFVRGEPNVTAAEVEFTTVNAKTSVN